MKWVTLCSPASLTCQVAEQGTHVELLAFKGMYYRLVKRQQQGWTKEDRDLSPMSRDPPMMSSYEEYEAVMPTSSTVSSLGNASVSLSSLQDSQMPPSEGLSGGMGQMMASRDGQGMVNVSASYGEAGAPGRWQLVEEAAPFQQLQHQQRGRQLSRGSRDHGGVLGSSHRRGSEELVLQRESETQQQSQSQLHFQQQHTQQQQQQRENSPRGRGTLTGEERAAAAAVAAEHQVQPRRQGSLQNDIVPMPKALGSERAGLVPVSAVATGPVEVVGGAAAVSEGGIHTMCVADNSSSVSAGSKSPRSMGSQDPPSGSPRGL